MLLHGGSPHRSLPYYSAIYLLIDNADQARVPYLSSLSLHRPTQPQFVSPFCSFTTTTIIVMSAKFDKAVEIVQNLPKDGPIKPTQDEQLYVSSEWCPFPAVISFSLFFGEGSGSDTSNNNS